MKPFQTNIPIFAALFFLFISRGVSQTIDSVATVRDIWALEERYWHDVQKLDVADFLALWHDDFRGWPATSGKPIPKDSAANMIREPMARGSRMTEYKLHRKVVQPFGNTAIAIYAVTFTWIDHRGKVERTGQWYKLIHTWLRAGGQWKIIGSLSAALPGPDVD